MGWAARAHERRGNPSPERLQIRAIDTRKVEAHFKTHHVPAPVQFSDRAYTMDARGTLRRASWRVMAQAPNIMPKAHGG